MFNTIFDANGDASVNDKTVSRRRFLSTAGAGALAVAGLAAMSKKAEAHGSSHDQAIIQAAATAEALATTMYFNIVNSSIYTDGLSTNANDQAYLVAGYEEELDHYQLLSSVYPALATTFYFPTGMFGDPSTYRTTVNTLVTLEDAFIAAYLIGIRDLSSPGLKVLAGQIMGVESEHRAFGRVIAADLNLHSTTGLSGTAEGVDGTSNFAANNLSYERTFAGPGGLNQISDVVNALKPFLGVPTAGFSTTPYKLSDSLGLNERIVLSNTTP